MYLGTQTIIDNLTTVGLDTEVVSKMRTHRLEIQVRVKYELMNLMNSLGSLELKVYKV